MAHESSENTPQSPSFHRIGLLDNTTTATNDPDDSRSESGSAIVTSLSKRLSIREQRKQWKRSRYTAERAGSTDLSKTSTWGLSSIDRGRQRISQKLNSRRVAHLSTGDNVELDVLYESERGLYCFGFPFFSSNALYQWDAPPWADENLEKTTVTTLDAQVPDPTWTWSWKNWYVDMERDCDEQGWEYSFMFNGFNWHGTHPWYHSFVRRRRWLRQRTRKLLDTTTRVFGDIDSASDYFTVNAAKPQTPGSGLQTPTWFQESESPGPDDKQPLPDTPKKNKSDPIAFLKEAPVKGEESLLEHQDSESTRHITKSPGGWVDGTNDTTDEEGEDIKVLEPVATQLIDD
jgi:hypothetical protein